MIKEILKSALAGVLAAIALFVLPFFFLRMLVFFLLVGAIFRLMGGRRRGMHRYAYAHHCRSMSEEERAAFIQKYGERCGTWHMPKNTETKNDTTATNP